MLLFEAMLGLWFQAMLAESERVIIGYHGTAGQHAEEILREGAFKPSKNDFDWLGHGIYFWEFAPCRAWRWAKRKYDANAAVIEATIHLGHCLDLTDIRYTDVIRRTFDGLREAYALRKMVMPANRGKARLLDCLVINYVAEYVFPECDTVRAAFLEGPPIFEGSAYFSESHIQVVVRKPIGRITDIRAIGVPEDCEP